MSFRDVQNPGIGGLDELTLSEEQAIQLIAGLGSPLQVLRTNAAGDALEFASIAAGGDVTKVGTPVDNQVGVWTGNGTIEGDAALTFDTTVDKLSAGGTTGSVDTGTIELGHATDTTISRASAGQIAVEGVNVLMNGGALGTPSSGTVTNLTGTASININGTVGATTPSTVVGTTITANTGIVPDINDGAYLGQAGLGFSDLFLASGATINYDSGNMVLTHSAGVLTLSNTNPVGTGPVFELYSDSVSPAPGDILGSINFYGRDSAGNKQIYGFIESTINSETSLGESSYIALGSMFDGALYASAYFKAEEWYPGDNGTTSLGKVITGGFNALFLSEGGVINWDNSDITLTQSGNSLTLAGGDLLAGSNHIRFGTADGTAFVDIQGVSGAAQGLRIQGAAATDISFSTFVAADSFLRFSFRPDGLMQWGSGALSSDTNLYRSAASVLKTDDLMVASLGFQPASNDGAALGVAGTAFSDLFLAEGGVINWDNGDMTLTQTGNVLAVAGGNLSVETGANILVNGSNPTRTLVLTAGGGFPSTTAGCATNTKVETTTNDMNYYVLDFDATTDENAEWTVIMPDSYSGGTITAVFYWTAASGSGDVIWAIQGRAFAEGDALDQAFGTAVTVTDTLTTAGDLHISSATGACTLAGAPAGGQLVALKVYRDANAGGDTLGVDARLMAVKIEYPISTYSD